MLKVGLTGGYATGKSFVAGEMRRLGCKVVHADELGHQVLLPDGEAYKPVVKRFGPTILSDVGVIDRKRLASLVFGNPELLRELSGLVHPAVYKLQDEFFDKVSAEDPHGVAVVEAAILIETGRYRAYDKLLVTTCTRSLQIERAMQRDSLSREQVTARLNSQMPAEEKASYADWVIDTGLTKEETVRQIEMAVAQLKDMAGQRSS